MVNSATPMIRALRGVQPRIAASAYIDPSAQVIGDVEIGERSSIWPNAVLRGDVNPIWIGKETNIQDCSVVHGDSGEYSTWIGDRVTVGHSVVLHGCRVEDGCVVGIGAIVLNGARVGRGSVIGAGSLVPEGAEIPPDSLVLGVPGKVHRTLSSEERARFERHAPRYIARAQLFKEELP